MKVIAIEKRLYYGLFLKLEGNLKKHLASFADRGHENAEVTD